MTPARDPGGSGPLPGQMPPDPWAEEGIDLWTLEQAERLTREDVDPASRAWDELDGPTIEEFDEAAHEFERCRDGGECGAGPIGAIRPLLGAIAVVVLLAFVLTYVAR